MPKLDGTEVIAPTPFDAHEQTVRNPHGYSREEGYAPAEAAVGQEYPKHVLVGEGDAAEIKTVNNAKEEAALTKPAA